MVRCPFCHHYVLSMYALALHRERRHASFSGVDIDAVHYKSRKLSAQAKQQRSNIPGAALSPEPTSAEGA